MSHLDLDQIRARVDVATDGPWEAVVDSDHKGVNFSIWAGDDNSGRYITERVLPSLADAEFIAHARTDVPALVAEVRRLREALRRRNDSPSDETMARWLKRSQHNIKSRPWRMVGYLIRCWQQAIAERDEALAQLADARNHRR